MIEKTELIAVGNLLTYNYEVVKVVSIDDDYIGINRITFDYLEYSDLEQIKLTEQILLDVGFEKVLCKKTGIRAQYSFSGIRLDLSNIGLVYLSYKSICIEYLHTLQNLCAVLGKDLDVSKLFK